MTDIGRTFHPAIDEVANRLAQAGQLGNPGATPEVLIAIGRDLSRQLSIIADHLTVESIVQESNGFGRVPAGHADPTVATKDTATGHRLEAPPATIDPDLVDHR